MSDRFVHAVEAIYASAAEPSRWPLALQAVADVFDDVGAVLIFGKDDGTFGVIDSPSLATISAEYREGWSDKDIRAIRGRERGYFAGNDVVTDRDVVTVEEMGTNPFYADLLRRHGLKYFACAFASPDPRVEVGVSVQRAATKPAYSEAELDLLARLSPHIERSLRLGIRLMDAELSKLGLADALARVGIGVFVLDSIGRVIFSNDASRSLVGDGLDIVNERLVTSQSPDGQQAAEAVKRAIRNDLLADPRPTLIQRRSQARPLALYALPIGFASTAPSTFLAHARAIVLVIDIETGGPADPALIRDILGLTLGEARIASLVGIGLAPRDAASKLGISEETARTVLKRVFAKVGVSRQSELASLLTKLILK
jgi:DNA-binding CsgD family transcriptional regulator